MQSTPLRLANKSQGLPFLSFFLFLSFFFFLFLITSRHFPRFLDGCKQLELSGDDVFDLNDIVADGNRMKILRTLRCLKKIADENALKVTLVEDPVVASQEAQRKGVDNKRSVRLFDEAPSPRALSNTGSGVFFEARPNSTSQEIVKLEETQKLYVYLDFSFFFSIFPIPFFLSIFFLFGFSFSFPLHFFLLVSMMLEFASFSGKVAKAATSLKGTAMLTQILEMRLILNSLTRSPRISWPTYCQRLCHTSERGTSMRRSLTTKSQTAATGMRKNIWASYSVLCDLFYFPNFLVTFFFIFYCRRRYSTHTDDSGARRDHQDPDTRK